MDPPTAARKFYEALGRVPGWERMTVTAAGQRVQASAYPTAYADDETIATQLYWRLAGASGHTTAAAAALAGDAPAASGAGCGSTGAGGAVSATGWSLPLDPGTYTLTSGYGPRRSLTGGTSTFHAGLDLGALSGTPIRAVADGTVTFAGRNGGYGNLVTIHTAPNVDTYYAHQVEGGIRVAAGDTVTAGQLIGAVGTTGDSTGPHLHFEVRVDGATVDPLPFLRQQGLDPGTLP
jgi:murein DD-endopeptidase MepM/ murein hydrolase activator NlpD